MVIAKVRIEKTLKGDRTYKVGEVLSSPLPYDILHEIKHNRGAVKVLEMDDAPAPKPIRNAQTSLTSIVSDNDMDGKSLDEQMDEMFKKKEPAQVKNIEPETPKQEEGSEKPKKVVRKIPKRKVATKPAEKKASIRKVKLGKRKRVNDESGDSNTDKAGS